ncbi:hypothetical protein LEP1GSC073_3410 [Leptospira noguchii str. Cascata]|nr:hypothetical protein LEP1GSC073_3410 [Leptospira noguchii str. Cascata]
MKFASDSPQFSYVELTLIIGISKKSFLKFDHEPLVCINK